MYIFEVARRQDQQAIQAYIAKEWHPEHILVKNDRLLEHEYVDQTQLNFVVVKDRDTSKICGILAFSRLSNLVDQSDIFTSLWKVSPDAKQPMLGMDLFRYICEHIPHRHLFSPGPNQRVLALYRRMKMEVGKMSQFYLINPTKTKFSIADRVAHGSDLGAPVGHPENLIPITTAAALREAYRPTAEMLQRRPFKDVDFLIKRYFDYPIHTYKVYQIRDPQSLLPQPGFVVTRIVHSQGAKALRIVDYIGHESLLIQLKDDLRSMVCREDCEYLDFVQHGIDDAILEAAGLTKLNPEGPAIIPNYFSPFVRENISINYYANVKPGIKHYIFKADGDQDRPVWNGQP